MEEQPGKASNGTRTGQLSKMEEQPGKASNGTRIGQVFQNGG